MSHLCLRKSQDWIDCRALQLGYLSHGERMELLIAGNAGGSVRVSREWFCDNGQFLPGKCPGSLALRITSGVNVLEDRGLMGGLTASYSRP